MILRKACSSSLEPRKVACAIRAMRRIFWAFRAPFAQAWWLLYGPPSKTRALVAALLLSLSGLGALGCASTGVAVRPGAEQQAVAKTRDAIAPVSFEGFTVDGVAEEAWLATQGRAERSQWENDKKGLALD